MKKLYTYRRKNDCLVLMASVDGFNPEEYVEVDEKEHTTFKHLFKKILCEQAEGTEVTLIISTAYAIGNSAKEIASRLKELRDSRVFVVDTQATGTWLTFYKHDIAANQTELRMLINTFTSLANMTHHFENYAFLNNLMIDAKKHIEIEYKLALRSFHKANDLRYHYDEDDGKPTSEELEDAEKIKEANIKNLAQLEIYADTFSPDFRQKMRILAEQSLLPESAEQKLNDLYEKGKERNEN